MTIKNKHLPEGEMKEFVDIFWNMIFNRQEFW